jgi:hypothetical protein
MNTKSKIRKRSESDYESDYDILKSLGLVQVYRCNYEVSEIKKAK